MGNVIDAKKGNMHEEIAKFHLSDGRWRMYIKPYTMNLREELEGHRKSTYAARSISITETDGTYCITSKDIMHDFRDLYGSLWFRIFWRFRSEAMNTFATELVDNNTFRKQRWCDNEMNMEYNDENKEKYYYVVTLSPYFIEASSLPRFQGSACA